jgi:hypothetical protein
MQFWKTESFAVSLTNEVIGSNVILNQDFIDGYVGLGFDMSNFNGDGLGDVYIIGICMPISMVQYRNSFTWSKYSRHVFPNNLSRMILDNVDELFRQILTEFLQTDIDGSIKFSLNAITIQSLEKYFKTFYMPPLDIDQISSIWDQVLCNPKTVVTVAEGKQQLSLFQSSRQCFISVLWNIDFLNQLWSCYSSFTFKSNLLHMIIRYFLGINRSILSIVFIVGKK